MLDEATSVLSDIDMFGDWIVRPLRHAQQKSRLEDAARVMLKKVNQGELLMERRLTAENVKEALGQFPGLDMDCL